MSRRYGDCHVILLSVQLLWPCYCKVMPINAEIAMYLPGCIDMLLHHIMAAMSLLYCIAMILPAMFLRIDVASMPCHRVVFPCGCHVIAMLLRIVHVCIWWHFNTHTHTLAHTRARMHTHTHICTHTHPHTHTHSHTHTPHTTPHPTHSHASLASFARRPLLTPLHQRRA